MSRIPTAGVPIVILNRLFDEFDIWTKIQDGRLTSECVSPTPSLAWSNATSLIIKHFLPDGKHVITTHCIKDNASGKVLHWDAKDIKLGDVRLWKIPTPPRRTVWVRFRNLFLIIRALLHRIHLL